MSNRGKDKFFEPNPDIIERKLQHVQFSYGRWYGQDGDIEREKYLLPIDEEETDRLDIFHKIFLVARNDELFTAGLDTTKPLRILDLGTGTGIWAVDIKIPSTMQPPKLHDIEGPWNALGSDWDFIHVRSLYGSIKCWPSLYEKIFTHLKPETGHIEHIEIDWNPDCDDDSLPATSAFRQWSSLLLESMNSFGRSMGVQPDRTRSQLAAIRFVGIQERVIKAYCNAWPKDKKERQLGNWFNLGLSKSFAALSLKPMVTILGKSKDEVNALCSQVEGELCKLSCHAYCKIYIWIARKPELAKATPDPRFNNNSR